jgi:hypothetical protein
VDFRQVKKQEKWLSEKKVQSDAIKRERNWQK